MHDLDSKNGEARAAEADVDFIVREVIRRLAVDRPASADRGRAWDGKPNEVRHPSSVQLISDRVVTVASLKDKLNGCRSIRLARGGIVTPAAKDLLRERQVAIEYAEPATTSAAQGRARLLIAVAETGYEPAELLARLVRLQVVVEQMPRLGLADVIDDLADPIRLGGRRALLITDEPEAAICLANRLSGVRAARADCPVSAQRAQDAIGLNLLVLSPAGKSLHQLVRTTEAFLRGECNCPEKYRARLG